MSGQSTNGKLIKIAEVFPKEQGGLSSTLRLPAWGSCTKKTSPSTFDFESHQGLRSPRGLWKIETPLLKGTHKISHVPGLRAEAVSWKAPESDSPSDFENLPERQEATVAHPGDIDSSDSYFWEIILPHWHWCWQVTFWNPPCSLLASRLSPALAKQPVGTNTETPQAKQLTWQGHRPTHLQIGCLEILCVHSLSWT